MRRISREVTRKVVEAAALAATNQLSESAGHTPATTAATSVKSTRSWQLRSGQRIAPDQAAFPGRVFGNADRNAMDRTSDLAGAEQA